MSKRLAMLEKMTASGKADSFAWYALAMEYRGLERTEDALSTFAKLRELDAEYLPMYLMAAQVLYQEQKSTEALDWLQAGVSLAERKGDDKTLGELQSLSSQIQNDTNRDN
jgi:tetratricopeptide (TPR) repeat protein